MEYYYTEDVFTYLTYLRNTRLNLTFRLHSFLPCLAYNIPTIKISYDQRALSMLETIGMDEWNINLINQDLLPEVSYRLKNLENLESIKDTMRLSRWVELRNTISEYTEKFAERVKS